MPPAISAVAALAALLAAPALAQGIAVEDAYAIASRPGAPTAAAFMVIRNDGPADRLLSVASPAAERVELHDHLEENGVLRMVAVPEGFAVPADGALALERGGAHVMFLGIAGPFEDGALIPLTLRFERAGEVAVEVPVDLDRLGGAPGGHAGHGG